MKRFTTPSSKKTDKIIGMKRIGFLILLSSLCSFSNLFIFSNKIYAQGISVNHELYIYQKHEINNKTYTCQPSLNCLDSETKTHVDLKVSGANMTDYSLWKAHLKIGKNEIDVKQLSQDGRAFFEKNLDKGIYNVKIWLSWVDPSRNTVGFLLPILMDNYKITITEKCGSGAIFSCPETSAATQVDFSGSAEINYELCTQVKNINSAIKCTDCANLNGVWTALGCIYTDSTNIIQTLIKIGLLIGGGITLLIILAGSFILTISQGDPKKTSEAKEMITSAIIGLIFIIFSVSILQLIGVEILQIPQFGESAKVPLPVILK